MSVESVMLSNYLILCLLHFLLPTIFPSIRVFSNESALHIRLPKYWSFSFNISPTNEYSGLISFRKFPLGLTDWISLQSKGLSRVFSKSTVQKHQFHGAQLSLQSNSHIHTWLLENPYSWHHRLDGPEFEWTPGVGDGQGGLACLGSWGHKESGTPERLNWTPWKESYD